MCLIWLRPFLRPVAVCSSAVQALTATAMASTGERVPFHDDASRIQPYLPLKDTAELASSMVLVSFASLITVEVGVVVEGHGCALPSFVSAVQSLLRLASDAGAPPFTAAELRAWS